MRTSGALALAFVACTPTAIVDAEPVPDAAPAPVPESDATDNTHGLGWPGCAQEYPQELGLPGEPFVWQTTFMPNDLPCRYGCEAGQAAKTSSAPGITVAIVDDEVQVATRTWQANVPPVGLVPLHVQWTSWCGDWVTLAIHDRRTLRMVSFEATTGVLTEQIEQPIDPEHGVDPSFAMQMHCADQHTRLQARGRDGAWTMMLPTHGYPLRRVPADVWADITSRPHPHDGTDFIREEITTATRRYHRKGVELFAFDADDLPLWHRRVLDAKIGCLDDGQLMGIIGCGWCPSPREALTLVGEHIVLHHYGVEPSTDVFDADGTHVVHMSYDR